MQNSFKPVWFFLFIFFLLVLIILMVPKMRKVAKNDKSTLESWLSVDPENIQGIQLMSLHCNLSGAKTINTDIFISDRAQVFLISQCMQSQLEAGDFLGSFEHWTWSRLMRIDISFSTEEIKTFFVTFHSRKNVCNYAISRYAERDVYDAGNVISVGVSDRLAMILSDIITQHKGQWVSAEGDFGKKTSIH